MDGLDVERVVKQFAREITFTTGIIAHINKAQVKIL